MAAKKQATRTAPVAIEAAPPAARSKKTLIIAGAALLLTIGASVGGTLFFLDSGAEEEVVPAEPEFTEAAYYTFQPAFVVNYMVANKPRFLQTELALLARNPAVLDTVTQHAPLLRARLLDTLSSQNFLDLQTQAGKEGLQAALLETVNNILKEQGVDANAEQVLFSSFVLQ